MARCGPGCQGPHERGQPRSRRHRPGRDGLALALGGWAGAGGGLSPSAPRPWSPPAPRGQDARTHGGSGSSEGGRPQGAGVAMYRPRETPPWGPPLGGVLQPSPSSSTGTARQAWVPLGAVGCVGLPAPVVARLGAPQHLSPWALDLEGPWHKSRRARGAQAELSEEEEEEERGPRVQPVPLRPSCRPATEVGHPTLPALPPCLPGEKGGPLTGTRVLEKPRVLPAERTLRHSHPCMTLPARRILAQPECDRGKSRVWESPVGWLPGAPRPGPGAPLPLARAAPAA